jgi:hypothetical protein
MTCGSQIQYPAKALGDLTEMQLSFTALYFRQCLKGPLSEYTQDKLYRNSLFLPNEIFSCHIRPLKGKKGLNKHGIPNLHILHIVKT